MSALIEAKNLNKNYGRLRALQDVNLNVSAGQIVGLIGLNGAGKTTLLKSLLGFLRYRGDIEILGLHPRFKRSQLMERVSYIADVAILPRWLNANQLFDFMTGIHPQFHRQKALDFLSKTSIDLHKKIKTFSKGMMVQLHLALILAIDSELLVLDEPTLGLDILFRKEFYSDLLNHYFNENRSIVISTNQVEEIEHVITHVVMMNKGTIILNCSMENFANQFVEVLAPIENSPALNQLQPLVQQKQLNRMKYLFENVSKEKLKTLGVLSVPKVSDVFVAKVRGQS